jgi:phage terminase large subunit-like protein
MFKQNTFINLYMLKHGGKDKPMRSKSMQARMRAHGVKFNKGADWYPNFEEELLTFPRGKRDDQADAFAYLGLMLDKLIEAPTAAELQDEEYEEMMIDSGEDGRSTYTGY